MNWNQLKDKAKELGYKVNENMGEYTDGKTIECLSNYYTFWNNGTVCLQDSRAVICIKNRTPDQMWQIMEALK